jgi:FkbM family methyltransferase
MVLGVPVVLAPIDALGSLWAGACALTPSPVSEFLDDFAEGVIEVLTNPAAAEDCSKAGKERVAEYGFDRSAQELHQIIEEWHADVVLDGPLGPFVIPGAPRHTRRVCEFLSKQVWDGEYRHPEIQAPKTVLDIGAGWGAFTAWALKEWPDLSTVHCYEPHAAAAAMLVKNLSGHVAMIGREPHETLVGRRAVVLHEAAVSSDPKAVYACGDDWGAGRTAEQSQGETVKIVHPRDLPPADCVKLDAEGVEAMVLHHYPHLGQVNTLLLEWHTPELKAECHQIIQRRTKLRCVQQEDEKVRGYGVSIWVR